jgi:hypothetical protein
VAEAREEQLLARDGLRVAEAAMALITGQFQPQPSDCAVEPLGNAGLADLRSHSRLLDKQRAPPFGGQTGDQVLWPLPHEVPPEVGKHD